MSGRTKACGDCRGAGRTRDCEEIVRCERCEGVGELAECRRCLVATSPIEIEMLAGICRSCAIELETMAVEDDLAELRRSA